MQDDQILVQPEGAEELLAISGLIKDHLKRIENLTGQAKKYQEMLNDILENDETYRKHNQAAKEAGKVKSQTKQQILKMPQAQDLVSKIKDFRLQLKELKDGLSDYLAQYQKMTGAGEFEDDLGTLRKIVYVARLVKA